MTVVSLETAPAAAPAPRRYSRSAWLGAISAVLFVASMALAADSAVAWLAGSAFGAPLAGWIAAGVLALVTVWLLARYFRQCLEAEREVEIGASGRPAGPRAPAR